MAVAEHRFTNCPRAPGEARAWISGRLQVILPTDPRTDALLQDVLIVVSELVTNAVRCGATEGVLTYRLADGYLDVAVTDNGQGWPRLRDASPTDLHGPGLLVVSQLATTVGAEPIPGGKQVWATLTVDPALTDAGVAPR